MGAIIALRLALRLPDRVSKLVLTAGSGGLDMGRFGAADWRPAYRAAFPAAARWNETEKPDHTTEIGGIGKDTLLVVGEADAISPGAVGRQPERMMPNATHPYTHGRGEDWRRGREATQEEGVAGTHQ